MQTLQASFENRSGATLRGIVTLPDGEGAHPFAVLLHGFGGSCSGHRYQYVNLARALAKRGVGCARFDFFGCGESDGEFGDMTFTGLMDDAADMLAWATGQAYVDAKRLWLAGQSMGGYVAASLAPAAKPHGLVLMCPGAAMYYGAAERADMVVASGKDFADLEGLTYKMAFNYDMAAHPDPFEEARGFSGPALIIRANDDKLVSLESCQSYEALYDEARLVETSGGGHNFSSLASRRQVEREVADFILAH